MGTQALRPRRVHAFVSSISDHDLHEKRVASLADATVGALQGAQLAVGALGRALAVAKELDAKHAIKQVGLIFRGAAPSASLMNSPSARCVDLLHTKGQALAHRAHSWSCLGILE